MYMYAFFNTLQEKHHYIFATRCHKLFIFQPMHDILRLKNQKLSFCRLFTLSPPLPPPPTWQYVFSSPPIVYVGLDTIYKPGQVDYTGNFIPGAIKNKSEFFFQPVFCLQKNV